MSWMQRCFAWQRLFDNFISAIKCFVIISDFSVQDNEWFRHVYHKFFNHSIWILSAFLGHAALLAGAALHRNYCHCCRLFCSISKLNMTISGQLLLRSLLRLKGFSFLFFCNFYMISYFHWCILHKMQKRWADTQSSRVVALGKKVVEFPVLICAWFLKQIKKKLHRTMLILLLRSFRQ